MKTVAVLYICTGAYRVFWPTFYPNFRAHFLPDCQRTFFVFTDAQDLPFADADDVRIIPQEALPWPYSTMQRFEAFLGQEDALKDFDYLFFANANLHCLGDLLSDELLPDAAAGQSLVAVCHKPYYGRPVQFYPYERRAASRAYIPYCAGQYYVAGGLNGGTAAAYLAMCRELRTRTREDLDHGVIARFHDESQLNRLVAEDAAPFRILGPAYCCPEETPMDGERIRVLQKARFLDVAAVKVSASAPVPFLRRKWEAFCENYLPNVWYWRDKLLGRRVKRGE